MLIDSHCHLDFPELLGEIDAVLARAKAADVARMITISTKVSHFDAIRSIAEAHDNVFCTVGNHPHHAHIEPEISATALIDLARHPKCVGIGEAGLDYHYDKAPRETAARVFRAHIAAARDSGLPLVIHSRDADVDMARILREEMGQGAFKAVLHCFTSSRELALTGLELGLYVSFSGVLTFKNSDALRDIARETPLDRLLVETDAPYLAPAPYRGKRNEPAYVAQTAAVLAQVMGLSLTEIGAATSRNVQTLFNKMPPLEVAA